MASGIRRRRLLAKVGVLGAAVLAGCSSDGDSSDDDPSGDSTGGSDDAASTEEGDSGTDTDEDSSGTGDESEPSDEELLDQIHATTDIEETVQQLERDSVTLNFHPADPDAGYADSVVFSEFSPSGESILEVELDLGQAIQQRHHENLASQNQHVQEFVENVDDPEWRQQIIEEAGWENESVDWDIYTDDSLSYGERMRESNMIPFWYEFENQRFDGVGSENNQYKAQALQGAEKEAGFDTLIWDYGTPGHGLVSAIENPRSDETEEQETYVVETDFTDTEQVVKWEESQYSESGLHPAREKVDDREADFYSVQL